MTRFLPRTALAALCGLAAASALPAQEPERADSLDELLRDLPDEAYQEAPAPASYQLPVELCRGFWFVPITLAPREGYPEDRTLWFIYDTGAGYSVVDPDSLRRVTRRDIAEGVRANILDATSGPVTFNRLPARVTDLDHLSLALGREIDGILAVDAFEDFLTILDYQDEEMRLERGELPRPDGNEIFSANGRDKRPWLRVNVGGSRQSVLIDSGSNSAFTLRDIERFGLIGDPVQIRASTRIDGLERREAARLNGDLSFGPNRISRPVLSDTPGTQLFGSAVMEHFEWTFDQRNERVRLRPYAPGRALPSPGYVGHGLVTWGVNGALEVRGVLPGSPAEIADVRVGDRILRMNGRPVADRGCSTGPADRMSLRVRREAEPGAEDQTPEILDIQLDLFELVD